MTQQATGGSPAGAPSPAHPRRSPGRWSRPVPSATADSNDRFLGSQGGTPDTDVPDLTQYLKS